VRLVWWSYGLTLPLATGRRVASPLIAGPGPTFAISKVNSSGLFAGGWLRAPATTEIEGRPGAESRVLFPSTSCAGFSLSPNKVEVWRPFVLEEARTKTNGTDGTREW